MSPPATSDWVLSDVVDAALQQLRLGVADVDVERIEKLAAAACRHVDHEVDRESSGPVTVTMEAAAVQATVEAYTQPSNSFDSFAFAIQTGNDPRATIRRMVAPDKERWGIA